jgi:hypothetical protein
MDFAAAFDARVIRAALSILIKTGDTLAASPDFFDLFPDRLPFAFLMFGAI